MSAGTCSGGSDPTLCCIPGAWGRMQALGEIGFRTHGEPLPDEVIDTAAERGIDPHALDWHVEAIHGWEPHDVGYRRAVGIAADCLAAGGCETG